jgi:geranylgeranyl diphosphate synthase, type II
MGHSDSRPAVRPTRHTTVSLQSGAVSHDVGSLTSYLDECRALVLREIGDIIPSARHGQRLYELIRDYPLRGGKAMRPALCIATCRALGGSLESVLRSAAAIELYHNAFLVHEDRSELRRAEPTLHLKHGVPIAVNVGDGMLALSMSSLLANTRIVGVGKALRVLETISRMARESAEGQMIELDWIALGSWTLTDESYVRMVYKKTTWYSFITPVRVGAIVSGASSREMNAFARFASLLGVAFQLQDDVLNLVGAGRYGKEIGGDLWEGKHSLILIHALRHASKDERAEAIRVLRKKRPPAASIGEDPSQDVESLLRELRAQDTLSEEHSLRLSKAIDARRASAYKTHADVAFLRQLIERYDGIGYASEVALRRAAAAARAFARLRPSLAPSAHTDFLRSLVDFVVRRTH